MSNELRQLRHDLRGGANVLMLCVASLKYADRQQQVEFLDDIIKATDQTLAILNQLEAIPEHFTTDAE